MEKSKKRVEAARTWIASKPRRRANGPGRPSSYEAKHVFEAETGVYVTDQEFQTAARRAGVELFWPTGSLASESPYVGIKV